MTTSSSGTWYFGCSGSATLNFSGAANTNPYFTAQNIGKFDVGTWYLYVGIMHHDGQTATTGAGGYWNCTTGKKLGGSTEYKWISGKTEQTLRNFLCYSADGHMQFYDPGVYEINGTEPTVSELLEKGRPNTEAGLGSFVPYDTTLSVNMGNSASYNWSGHGIPGNVWVSATVFLSSTDAADQSDHFSLHMGNADSTATSWGDTFPAAVPPHGVTPFTHLGDSQGVAIGHYGDWMAGIFKTASDGSIKLRLVGTSGNGSGVYVKVNGYWR